MKASFSSATFSHSVGRRNLFDVRALDGRAGPDNPSGQLASRKSGAAQTIDCQPRPTVTVTTGGITIDLIFDTAAMAAPASFRAGIQRLRPSWPELDLPTKSRSICTFDYSGTGGGAAAGPDSGYYENYSPIRSDLIRSPRPATQTFNFLPSGTSDPGAIQRRRLERRDEAVRADGTPMTPRPMMAAPISPPTSTRICWWAWRCMN